MVVTLVVSRPWGTPRGARRRSAVARRTGSPRRSYCRALGPEQRRRPTLAGKRIDSVHRYYDPVTGEFLSVDPLANETGTAYAFTGGDPVNGSDPSGLICTKPGPNHTCLKGTDSEYNGTRSCPNGVWNANGSCAPPVNCGPNFAQTGICPGHPNDNFNAGPSIFTNWNFSAGVCPLVGCLAISFQNGRVQVSGGLGLAISFPGISTGYNQDQLRCGATQSNTVFGSTPIGQITINPRNDHVSVGNGPSVVSGWGGGYAHLWSYGWQL